MINTDAIQSSSAIEGFGFTDRQLGQLIIPGGTTIVPFTPVDYTLNVQRKDPETVVEVLFQLIGPSSTDGSTHDPNKWKRGDGGGQGFFNLDGTGLHLFLYVYYYTPTLVNLLIEFNNFTGGNITYAPTLTINAKLDFSKYPWGS